jgi:hypothetical protein
VPRFERLGIRRRDQKKKKGYVDCSETFDEFLAKDGLLAETEDAAFKEIIADQIGSRIARSSRSSVSGYIRPPMSGRTMRTDIG